MNPTASLRMANRLIEVQRELLETRPGYSRSLKQGRLNWKIMRRNYRARSSTNRERTNYDPLDVEIPILKGEDGEGSTQVKMDHSIKIDEQKYLQFTERRDRKVYDIF